MCRGIVEASQNVEAKILVLKLGAWDKRSWRRNRLLRGYS